MANDHLDQVGMGHQGQPLAHIRRLPPAFCRAYRTPLDRGVRSEMLKMVSVLRAVQCSVIRVYHDAQLLYLQVPLQVSPVPAQGGRQQY